MNEQVSDETGEQEIYNSPEQANQRTNSKSDLTDSARDQERMQPEETVLDLPDVKDIPGQEHIVPPGLGRYADVTASSDDEEGAGLLDDEEEDDIAGISSGSDDDDSDITPEDIDILETTEGDMPMEDNTNLRTSALDDTDFEGDPLNEGSFGEDISGKDIDTSGIDEDDDMEDIGEEDEENNTYSASDNDNT